jgi:hypothetical protein
MLKLKPIFLFLLVAAVVALPAGAQSSPNSNPSSNDQQPSSSAQQQDTDKAKQDQGQDQAQNKDKQDQDKDKDKKDKKKKDKKKKNDSDGSELGGASSEAFSTAAANDVLKTLADGLEGHSQRLMLSAFDDSKMDGYLQFEDQIEAFFRRYESFRVHFRISQASQEGDKGVVLVDIEMEELPRSSGAPVRKHDSMRFELERGRKGWRIVDFRPRQFFS